jgi:hypothetical protein
MDTYGLRCQKNLVKFEMELTQYENAEFIYVVRFKKVNGDIAPYRDLV